LTRSNNFFLAMKFAFEDIKKSVDYPLLAAFQLPSSYNINERGYDMYNGDMYNGDMYNGCSPVLNELLDASQAFSNEMQKWNGLTHLVSSQIQDPTTQLMVNNYLNTKARDSAYSKALPFGGSAVSTMVNASKIFHNEMDEWTLINHAANSSCHNPAVRFMVSDYINHMAQASAYDKCRQYVRQHCDKPYGSPYGGPYDGPYGGPYDGFY